MVVEARVARAQARDHLAGDTDGAEHVRHEAPRSELALHLVPRSAPALRCADQLEDPLVRALVARGEGMGDAAVAPGVEAFAQRRAEDGRQPLLERARRQHHADAVLERIVTQEVQRRLAIEVARGPLAGVEQVVNPPAGGLAQRERHVGEARRLALEAKAAEVAAHARDQGHALGLAVEYRDQLGAHLGLAGFEAGARGGRERLDVTRVGAEAPSRVAIVRMDHAARASRCRTTRRA